MSLQIKFHRVRVDDSKKTVDDSKKTVEGDDNPTVEGLYDPIVERKDPIVELFEDPIVEIEGRWVEDPIQTRRFNLKIEVGGSFVMIKMLLVAVLRQ